MICFKSIDIQSFKGIFHCFLDFEDLSENLYSLEGINNTADFAKSNGACKSTLLQAIMFALYGTVDDIYIKSSEYQNKFTSIPLKIILSFSVQNSNYKVERTLKSLKLYLEDEDISELTKTDTENLLKQKLGLTKAEFTSFTYLSQSSSGSFLSKTPSEKLSCIKDFIFGEELLSIQNKLSDLILKYKNTVTEYNRKLSYLEGEKTTLENLLSSYNKAANDNEVFPYTLSEYKQQLDDQEQRLHKMLSLTGQKKSIQDSQLNIKRKAQSIKTRFQVAKNNICPTCGQTLKDNKVKEDLKREAEELKQKARDIENQLGDLDLQLSELGDVETIKREIKNLNSIISRIERKQSTAEVGYDDIESKLTNNSKEIAVLTESITLCEFKLQKLNKLQKYFKDSFIQHIQQAFLKEIENYLNIYCYDVFGEEFKLKFSGNSLEITVGDKPYSYFSGGERQRLDFIFVFAIKVALMTFTDKSTNLFICDESLSGQDSLAFEGCIELISRLTVAEGIITILVSHRDIEYQKNKIIIERQKDNTKLTILHNI